MTKSHKHKDLIIAWADGAEIQQMVPPEKGGLGGWHKFDGNWEKMPDYYVYRLKPEVGSSKMEHTSQEPVAWIWLDDWLNDGYPEDCFSRVNHQNKTPLYAAPVRTKDLTKEEIQNAMMPIEPTGKDYFLRLARAVIAAYKEKQNELVG